MGKERPIYEEEAEEKEVADPDEVPIRDRTLVTTPYDLVVESLLTQIENKTLHLRPLSDRPSFQRRYVWPSKLASRLIESILLNVPIPPCYLSQNEEYELDVIDGQQRIYSLYRFANNEFALSQLEVLKEFNSLRFHELPRRDRRKLETYTLRCVVIKNESHPELKFDVFERLNTNTVPLNAQELRNCIYRGALNSLLQDLAAYPPWLNILRRRQPDKRMRDEELILRFFAFYIRGVEKYRTPQKHWLNEVAKEGQKFGQKKIAQLAEAWTGAIDNSLLVFEPHECFRRLPVDSSRVINRALMDLVLQSVANKHPDEVRGASKSFYSRYSRLFKNDEFTDLISKSVDHKSRTLRRFQIWNDEVLDGLFD